MGFSLAAESDDNYSSYSARAFSRGGFSYCGTGCVRPWASLVTAPRFWNSDWVVEARRLSCSVGSLPPSHQSGADGFFSVVAF